MGEIWYFSEKTPHGEMGDIRHLTERWERSDISWTDGRDFTPHGEMGEIRHL
jgi:hypothetical protein